MRKVKFAEMGNRIREARISRHLKQKDCLKPLGDITPQMLSDWENGYVCPTLSYLINISKFYNLSLDYIILGKGDELFNSELKTYKEVILSIISLLQSELFEMHKMSYDGSSKKYVELQTNDKMLVRFFEDQDRLYGVKHVMNKELFERALSELINKYDYSLKTAK